MSMVSQMMARIPIRPASFLLTSGGTHPSIISGGARIATFPPIETMESRVCMNSAWPLGLIRIIRNPFCQVESNSAEQTTRLDTASTSKTHHLPIQNFTLTISQFHNFTTFQVLSPITTTYTPDAIPAIRTFVSSPAITPFAYVVPKTPIRW